MPKAHINGVDLHYEVSGIGPSIVLCHGYTGSSYDWSFQIPALSKNYQVITMDQAIELIGTWIFEELKHGISKTIK